MVKLYKVGGCVRDKIMGVRAKDIDIACEAKSFDEMRDYVLSTGGKIFVEKPEYNTIRAHLNGEDADFVLCRRDGTYSDGRRPDSVEIGTIYDDLARRDFTMNAIAQDMETGQLIDPFGGQEDIKLKRIKCVGNTYARFGEDSLRMLRAIRFGITKGMFLSWTIEEFLKSPYNAELLLNVSQERIREELNKCFAHDTGLTLQVLEVFPHVREVLFSRGLKLTATMKQ